MGHGAGKLSVQLTLASTASLDSTFEVAIFSRPLPLAQDLVKLFAVAARSARLPQVATETIYQPRGESPKSRKLLGLIYPAEESLFLPLRLFALSTAGTRAAPVRRFSDQLLATRFFAASRRTIVSQRAFQRMWRSFAWRWSKFCLFLSLSPLASLLPRADDRS